MADRSVRVRLEAITSNFNRRISESAVLTRRFSNELESADGRMANLVQSTLALAPALVPLGAAGIPVLAGLTAQLGFAALGTGALVLGLNGVGDALKALDDYQVAPTEEHLQKLHQTLEALGPAGGEFVLFLDHVEPKFKQLRALAEQGLLPGVEDSIRQVVRLLPELRDLTFSVSATVGDLFRDAGDNLNDPQWRDFFNFLQRDARPTLTETGKAAGNFALTFANLIEAFEPLERDFSQGLLHMSQDLRDWSAGLEQTQGFQEFVSYIRENGPRALDTLGAFADAFIQIVEAAAPVGSVVLPLLTEVLHVVAAIANTPAGSVLVGIAAAVGVLGRSLALLKAVGLRGDNDPLIGRVLGVSQLKEVPGSYKKISAALAELTAAQEASAVAGAHARDSVFALIPDRQKRQAVYDAATAIDRVRAAEQGLADARAGRNEALKQTAITAGKAAALVGGLAVAETGIADHAGLANTATLALMGTLGGPWGVAIGAATGYALDLSHANDDLKNSIQAAQQAAEQADFGEWRKALQDVLEKNQQIQSDAKKDRDDQISFLQNPLKYTGQSFKKTFGDSLRGLNIIDSPGDAKKQADEQGKAFEKVRKNAVDLFAVLEGAQPKGLKLTDDELTNFVANIAPALQRAGLDVGKVLSDRSQWGSAQVAVKAWVDEMDSARGRSAAVGEALAKLDDQMTPTVDAAKQLADALDALFGPETSQAEALNSYLSGLRTLRSELEKTGHAVLGNSEAALKNQGLLIDQVKLLEDRVKSDSAAGVSGTQIVKTLLSGRQAIIDTAVAAGKSRAEVEKYVDSLGLAPSNLVTIIETPGLLTATQKMQALATLYGTTPREIRTLITQLNMDHSSAAIKELARQYHLTPTQVKTIIKLINGDPVLESLKSIGSKFVELDNKTLTIKARLIYEATHANGGLYAGDIANQHMPELAGPGTTRVWREPETGGEAYIPLANDHRRPRAISIWEQTGMALGVQFRRYAYGGVSSGPATASAMSGADLQQLGSAIARIQPRIGKVYLQPHDYARFSQEMLGEDLADAAGGGI